ARSWMLSAKYEQVLRAPRMRQYIVITAGQRPTVERGSIVGLVAPAYARRPVASRHCTRHAKLLLDYEHPATRDQRCNADHLVPPQDVVDDMEQHVDAHDDVEGARGLEVLQLGNVPHRTLGARLRAGEFHRLGAEIDGFDHEPQAECAFREISV